MNRLKTIPFFLFLLPVFFCLHGGVENFGVLYLSEVLLIGLYISIALSLLVLFFLLITKNKQVAYFVTFYTGVFYLFFGAIQDSLQELSWLSFLNRYSVLLSFLLISTICSIYLLKRKKIFQKKLFFYLNFLLIVYCVLDTALLLYKSFINTKSRVSQISFDYKKIKSKPNVYYLLFDGYPGYTSLQSEFGFKNDSLYNFLQLKEFTILPSFSNYNFTTFSMSSILSMQYLKDDYNHIHQLHDQHDFRNRFNEIKNADVFSIYKAMGYEIENYSIFDIGKLSSINPEITFMPIHTKVITAKMLHNRLIRNIGWWFRGTMLQNVFAFKEPLFQADTTNLDIINMVKGSLAKKSNSPKFCYAHFIMPHSPYFRDSTGQLINKLNQPWRNLNDTMYFIPYLKYTNSVIRLLTDEIVLKDPGAITIVMSDHGFRKEYKEKYYAAAFDNICAVRLPGNNLLPFQNSRSGVNFFRYLFNSQYGQQIPYIKDSTVWINY
jgi:hypothetical protein